ncbi:CDP-glycerol glycerophosphotransferase family protein [Desertibacillus haloalkaliphilus]|uniref:CDP-glycerol glycerophosphotransferase family protein n=1 Tax=Desertibacillus haloalkaliphilus TaxID=1328930 RepID=UPI001C27AB98|nr:CDP-glycerol glycerophosphotransferase family protein [Desertibacillus haloalkaliphilus]
MKRLKGCRPIIFLRRVPPANLPLEEEKQLYQTLEDILDATGTPTYFKTPAFKKWIYKKVGFIVKRIRRIHTLFDRYKISQTIYGSTINRYGSVVTSFAQSRQVFTVNIQHGILSELGHFPVNADLNLVWGPSHKDYLVSRGAPQDRIKNIGPVFVRNLDFKANHQPPKRSEALNILVAMQPLGNKYNKKMIRTIEQAANNISEPITINYKLHPDQNNKQRYQKHLIQQCSAVISHGQRSLQELINESDLVITPFSTVAYEALLNGKPVVFYKDPGDLYYLNNSPLYVHTSSELSNIFTAAINDQGFLPSLASKLALKDSPHEQPLTSERLLRFIEESET